MKVYYIYHVPEVKIGCTDHLSRRLKVQGYEDYQVLEAYEDIYEASDREIYLQKLMGYPVDVIPYWKSVENRNKDRSPRGLNHSSEAQSKRVLGKVWISKGEKEMYCNPEDIEAWIEDGWDISRCKKPERKKPVFPEGYINKGASTAASIEYRCPHCGKTGKGNIFKGNHFTRMICQKNNNKIH
jgi:hypothetical protein